MSSNMRIERDREVLLKRLSEMEEEVARLEEALTQSNRLATLGVLAGMIAHEFNNLLTPVMNYSHLAIESPNDQELVQKAMTRTVEGTERLAHISSSILGFMRDDRQLQDCDVRGVVEEALLCLVHEPEKRGIRVVKNIPAGLRANIRPVALEQVLLNVFLNAVRSMQTNGGELRIDAGIDKANDDGGKTVIISVVDTGVGINRSVLEEVTEQSTPDEKQNGTPNPGLRVLRHASGNGLGLAVCRRLIEEAGGTISIRNRAHGSGAVFEIRVQGSTHNGN